MKTEINGLIRAFREVYSGNPWYGQSILSIIDDIDFQIATKKQVSNVHSIIEIVRHMLAWRNFALEKLRGDHALDTLMNDNQDWEKIDHSDPMEWSKTTAGLKTNQIEILEELTKMEDEHLNNIVPRRDYTFRFLLNGIVQHDLYHLGQIAVLKKTLS